MSFRLALRRVSLPTGISQAISRVNWMQVGKWLTLCLLVAAAAMIYHYAQSIDWKAVVAAIRGYAARDLALAAGLTLSSFVVYSCFDLFGRHYTGHRLPAWRVMLIGSTSYAFNLTLGSVVGAAGTRLRLYQQRGLKATTVAQIIAISVGINWLGYAALASVLFAADMVRLPEAWDVSARTLPIIGWILMAIVLSYLAVTAFLGDRKFTVRGRDATFPKLPAALLQLVVGASNWALMGSVLYCLLQGKADYGLALAVVMVASVAGLISRIPGGIGVLEATAVALLGPQLGESRVIAAILSYRAIYYLAPLILASLGFLALETLDRKSAVEAS